ncbi:hypothetical protein PIB30_038583 [Stylosanthes scabra]|uniref:Uncharacterized protein n=1 Tax=Stylosanthes scabra TaxID=79078 RepID=A0ABU6QDI3_9FABA|nr:hypothetical protein [Stylosanthes scabra]
MQTNGLNKAMQMTLYLASPQNKPRENWFVAGGSRPAAAAGSSAPAFESPVTAGGLPPLFALRPLIASARRFCFSSSLLRLCSPLGLVWLYQKEH